jgi:hypothetical protein
MNREIKLRKFDLAKLQHGWRQAPFDQELVLEDDELLLIKIPNFINRDKKTFFIFRLTQSLNVQKGHRNFKLDKGLDLDFFTHNKEHLVDNSEMAINVSKVNYLFTILLQNTYLWKVVKIRSDYDEELDEENYILKNY